MKRQLCRYILPNIFAMMGISCYILADTFFISLAAGADGITTLNLVLPIYGVLFAIGSMIGIGSATRYSIRKAQGSRDIDHYFSNAIIWGVLIGLVFTFLGGFYPEKMLQMMGADEEILAVGVPYARIFPLFSIFFICNYTFTSFVRNDGAPKVAMAATLLSSLFNIVFDYVFMFPMGMGLQGAALATGISPILSILITMSHYFSSKNTIVFRVALPSFKRLLEVCSLGIVAFVGEMANSITTLVFNFILLGLSGNLGVAAYGVVANIALVAISIFNGISQGLQPLASEANGKADRNMEKNILKFSLSIGIVVSLVIVAFVWIFSDECVRLFNSENSAQMAIYAKTGIRLYFLGFLLAGSNIILSGFLSATGQALQSAVIAMSRGVVAISIFAFVLSGLCGMTGVWLAFPAAEALTLLLALGMMTARKKGEKG